MVGAARPSTRKGKARDKGASAGRQGLSLCRHCRLPVDGNAYSNSKGELLHGECIAQLVLKSRQEEAEAQQQDAATLKEKRRADFDIGWKVERIPPNVKLAEKLTGHPLGEGMCCVRLIGGSNSVCVAPTLEPATSLNLEYLSIALQVRRNEGKEPFFSLDPLASPNPNMMQAKHYDPEWLAGTSVGEVLFQADYYLKELSMGEYEQPVLGMRSGFDLCGAEGHGREWSAREWFVVRKAELQISEGKVLIPQIRMGVEAREQVVGADGLEDVKHTRPDHPLVKYADSFTHNFDLIAERKSVIYHLREVAKASLIAKLLLEAEADLDKSWFELADEAKPTCCLEVPQLWCDRVHAQIRVEACTSPRGAPGVSAEGASAGTRVYGGVQFGLDRFSLAQARAGAPMARAASLSATMMRAPAGTGVRAGVSASLRAPGISAALGARAGISAASIAPSVLPQAFRAAPGALRTARGVDLNLDRADVSRPLKAMPPASSSTLRLDSCVAMGKAFWTAVDADATSLFKDSDKSLLKAIFNPSLSDRRAEGDRFVPPDTSVSYLARLRELVQEEEMVRQSRKLHFLSEGFAIEDAGPLFPASWTSSIKIAGRSAAGHANATPTLRAEHRAEAAVFSRCLLKSAKPMFNKSTEDGMVFRIYRVGSLEVRTTQEKGGDEKIGAVFSLVL